MASNVASGDLTLNLTPVILMAMRFFVAGALVLALLPAAVGPRAAASPTSVSGRVLLLKGGSPRPDASNAVVWIEGPRGGGGAGTVLRMTQESKRFSPRILVVPRQGTVEFPNNDAVYHNVFSVSGPNRFDLGLYRSGASKSRSFGEPGLVQLYCNIHPQMVGFLIVVDSDFAAITDKDGAFRFEGVPAGSWTLKAWHEEGSETSVPFAVPASADTPLTVSIDTTAYRPVPHKNKYGKDYPPQSGSDDERY
jgi:plastocyanin